MKVEVPFVQECGLLLSSVYGLDERIMRLTWA